MANDEVVIRIRAADLTKDAFEKARRQLEKLGREAGIVRGKTSGLGKDFGKLGSDLASSVPGVSRFSGALGGLSPVALGAAAGIGALGAAVGTGVSHLVQLGGELTDLRAKTGLSTDALQELRFAAGQSGVGLDVVTDAVLRLGRRAAAELPEATKNLQKLGLSVQDITSRNPEDAFELVAKKIAEIGPGANQAAIAMGVFGDAGLRLLPALNDGLDENIQKFRDLGIAISEEALEAGDRLGDSWEALKATGLSLLGEAVGPLVAGLADVTSAMVTQIATVNKANREQAEFLALVRELGSEEAARAEQVRVAAETQRRAAEEQASAAREAAHASFEGMLQNLATADSRVADARATEEQSKRTSELAKSVGLTVAEFQEKDEAFRKATEAALDNEKAVEANEKALEKQRKEMEKAREEAERYAEFLDQLTTNAFAAAEAITRASIAQQEFNQGVRDAVKEDLPFDPDIPEGAAPVTPGAIPGSVGGIIPGVVEGIGDIEAATEKAAEEAERFDDALERANALAQLIGGSLGDVVGQIIGATGAAKELSKTFKGGFDDLFSGDILSDIGNLANLAGLGITIGSAIAKGLGSLFGGGPDLVRDASRDLGATISEEMAKAIEESGRPIQLAIADIFEAGGFESVDRFAEEVGDLFSGLERGEFAEPEFLKALEESIPHLTENISEMGETGVRELERIFAAAAATGTAFEGMDELARVYVERARELGIEINNVALETLGLGDALQGSFAPDTLEGFAEQMGISTERARELAESLGLNFQTNLERMAEGAGVTVDQFRALQDALGEQLGRDLSADDVVAFLESTGASAEDVLQRIGQSGEEAGGDIADGLGGGAEAAQELAETIGGQLVEGSEEGDAALQKLAETLGGAKIGEGLEDGAIAAEGLTGNLGEGAANVDNLGAAQASANEAIGAGVGLAGSLAEALERAARAAGGIQIPSIPSTAGTSAEAIGAQGGFFSPALPRDTLIQAHRGEFVDISPHGPQGGGGVVFSPSIAVSVNPRAITTGGARELIRDLEPALEEALSSGTLRGKILKMLQNSGIRGPRA